MKPRIRKKEKLRIMNHKCGSCEEPLTDGAHCTVCNQELHFRCAGITETGYRKLGDRKLTWRCSSCKISASNLVGNAFQPVTPMSSPTPVPETESMVLHEIRALSLKFATFENMKEEIIALRSEFAEFKTTMANQYSEVMKEFTGKLNDMELRIVKVERVQDQVEQLQARLDKLEEDNINKDQWSRMNNVEVKGVPQTSNENLFEIIAKIGAKINYPVSKNQINFITRVPTSEKDRIKPIIVRFCQRYVKEDFIAAARHELKTSPLKPVAIGLIGNHKIFINDHLTIRNKMLLSKTKKTSAEMDFKYVWVKHAKIHVRKNDTSPILVIKSEKDLQKIT